MAKSTGAKAEVRTKTTWKNAIKRDWQLYLLLLLPVALVLVFNYAAYPGLCIAFMDYKPIKGSAGSEWVGMEVFQKIFKDPDFLRALRNSIVFNLLDLMVGFPMPIILALMLNELRFMRFKKVTQTILYLPHFLSWVVLAAVVVNMVNLDGPVNQLLAALGLSKINFLGSNVWFRPLIIITDVWKEFGYNSIVYLAAITGIDQSLYEAATMDGAGRFRKMWHITLPGMRMIIVLMAVLSLGNILNAGFDQIWNLISPQVYETGDVIDTFIYRIGMIDAQFGPATAMGVFKSAVSCFFISVSYYLAYKLFDYRVF